MSRQMVYTSASEGLKRGSSGFCTVAADGGMSPALMTKLEFLSGYEFRYNLSDPDSDKNPVSFCHTQIKLGGRTAHVLSRVAACGADYSGRTNKIAHHFLLEDGELLPCGPAQMIRRMEAKGLFSRNWDGPPRSLDSLDLTGKIGDSSEVGKPAEHWESHGDAGWGGLLPRAFCRSQKLPSYVIFEPGTDLLALFGESLQVLPARMRWGVDFATYYASSPPNCHYHWRGILAGSAVIREAARFPNAVKLDLTRPLGAVPDSEEDEYTKAARQGQVAPSLQEVPAPAPAGRAGAKRSAVATATQWDLSEAIGAEADTSSAARSESDRWDPRVVHKASTPWAKWILIMFSASVFALAVAGGTWFWLKRSNPDPADKAGPRVAMDSRQRDSDRSDSPAPEKNRSGKASADSSSAGGNRENAKGEGNPDSNSEIRQEKTERGATGPGRDGETEGQAPKDDAEQEEEKASPAFPVRDLKAEHIPPQSIKLTWRWRKGGADTNTRLTLQRRCGDGKWQSVENDIKTDQKEYRDRRLSPGEYQYRFTLKKPLPKPETIFPKVSIPRLHIIPIHKVLWPQSDSVHETIWLTTELRKKGGAHPFPEDIKGNGEFRLVSVSYYNNKSLPVEMAIAGDAQDDRRGQYIVVRSNDDDNADGRELLRAYIKTDPNKEKVWLVCDPNDKAWPKPKLQSAMRHCVIRIRLRDADRIVQFAMRSNPEKLAQTQIQCGWSQGDKGVTLLKQNLPSTYPWPKGLRVRPESGAKDTEWWPRVQVGDIEIDTSVQFVSVENSTTMKWEGLNKELQSWSRDIHSEAEEKKKKEAKKQEVERLNKEIKALERARKKKDKQYRNETDKEKKQKLKESWEELEDEYQKKKGTLEKSESDLARLNRTYPVAKTKAVRAEEKLKKVSKKLDGKSFRVVDPWDLPVARFKISFPTQEKAGSDQ